jgi:hypothetical protein
MNPDAEKKAFLDEIFATLDQALRIVVGDPVADLADAIVGGNPTDEQLSAFTNIVHHEFDEHDGCMISTIKELAQVGYPHYALNHVIRTYVRLNDKRELAQKEN